MKFVLANNFRIDYCLIRQVRPRAIYFIAESGFKKQSKNCSEKCFVLEKRKVEIIQPRLAGSICQEGRRKLLRWLQPFTYGMAAFQYLTRGHGFVQLRSSYW